MEAPTITIGKITATLGRPSALACLALVRSSEEIEADGWEVGIALGAAAIGLCWPKGTTWPVPLPPPPWHPGINVQRWGRDIFDSLCEGLDLPPLDLLDHTRAAYDWAVNGRLLKSEVQAAQDFSAAPPGA